MFTEECYWPCLWAGEWSRSLPALFFYDFSVNMCTPSWNIQQHGRVSPFVFSSGKSRTFFFFCHYSHSLSLLNLPPLCLLWESARSSARWQKPSHHLYLMESLGICGWYFPPKLETSCESRCLLTPCLLSQQSEHQGMFANLMGSWQRPSQTQTLLPASQGRICPHCCFGFERAG